MSRNARRVRLTPDEALHVTTMLFATGDGDDKAMGLTIQKASANGNRPCQTPNLRGRLASRVHRLVRQHREKSGTCPDA